MMKQKLRVTGPYVGLLVIPLLALTGSAVAQEPKPSPTPPAGEGLIYVYREPRFLNKGAYPSIFVNDYFLAELHNGEYVSLAVKEGTTVVTASAPTARLANPYAKRVKPPSTAGYWASLPGCDGLDWGRLALAPAADIAICQHNLAQLYEECGATSKMVGSYLTGGVITVHVPACNHRLDGSGNAFHLLFLAEWARRVKIEVQAGKTYYVEWSASSITYKAETFALVDEATGAKAIAKFKSAKER